VINKYEICFSNSEYIVRYDLVASRQISEPKYMDVDLLKNLGPWDSLSALLEVAGWAELMRLALPMYEHLYWEFLSSLRVELGAPLKLICPHPIFDFLIKILRQT